MSATLVEIDFQLTSIRHRQRLYHASSQLRRTEMPSLAQTCRPSSTSAASDSATNPPARMNEPMLLTRRSRSSLAIVASSARSSFSVAGAEMAWGALVVGDDDRARESRE